MIIVEMFKGSAFDQINAGHIRHIPHATEMRDGNKKKELFKKIVDKNKLKKIKKKKTIIKQKQKITTETSQ